MKQTITFFFISFIAFISNAQLVINELDSDTPGVDNEEFIEILSDIPNFSLDGFVIVLFNGSTAGGDSSYFTIDLDGFTTDINGLLLIGSSNVSPFPQLLIPPNVIQNGADAIAIYQADDTDFPDGTLATQTNLIDALVYDTSDPDDTGLLMLLGVSEQINEGSSGNTNSIQRDNDGTYFIGPPTPRQLNDGSGVVLNGISISLPQTQFDEGDIFDITFTTEQNVTENLTLTFSLNNGGFNTSDFTGNTSVTILNGTNTTSTTITLIDDAIDEGDEVLEVQLSGLSNEFIALNNNIEARIVDNDFQVANFGTPANPTFGVVNSTQPSGYYDSLNGLSGSALRQELQDIISDPASVRTQTFRDVIDILKVADQNPENSNQVWLIYTEQGRAKLDFQTTSDNVGRWNREHTYPRSRGGFDDIDADDVADGINVFITTNADSLRHANSDAHAIRAADGPENSIRSNRHYGDYIGPNGNLGSFRGDVARSVLYIAVRYNGLEVVNGFPATTGNGELGDLATLLDWHRNDPPDDYELNRNNIVYTWQFNRNPFIDLPNLVEFIFGNNVGDIWNDTLSVNDFENSNIAIFPNPTSDKIEIQGINKAFTAQLYTIEGKMIFEQEYNSNASINLNIDAGIYLLQLISDGQTTTQKIIKQ